MKESFNKITQASTAILITCIVVYGIVYAQQVCWSATVNACILTSNRISVVYASGNSWTSSLSHQRSYQLRSNFCSKSFLADFGAGNTCCETDRCDSYNQATYFSLSVIQDLYQFQKNVSSYDADNSLQTTFEPYGLPTSLKAVPIYIMTQSIIC